VFGEAFLEPIRSGIVHLLSVGLAIIVAILGKSPMAPPIPGKSLLVRTLGAMMAIILVILLWLSNGRWNSQDLAEAALTSGMTGFVAIVLYLTLYDFYCPSCRDDRERHLAGFLVRSEVREILSGSKVRTWAGSQIPAPGDAADYFCNNGKNAAQVWTFGSRIALGLVMTLLYSLALIGVGAGISSAWMIYARDDVVVRSVNKQTVVTLPSDVLFETDRANLRPAGISALKEAATILKTRQVRRAAIEGHTDSLGSAAHNLRLSERRAAAVYQWLTGPGGLTNVRFEVHSLGSSQPAAPNVRSDGSDYPEGRALNRRVEIEFAVN